jgi:hypothetical protein
LLDPRGQKPLNIFWAKIVRKTKKICRDKIRCCHPLVCFPSPVHRSDPPRAPGDPDDPTTHWPACDTQHPLIFFRAARPSASPRSHLRSYHPQWCKPMAGPPGAKTPLLIFSRKIVQNAPKKYVGYKIRCCHPPVCLPSPVHRSDPLRPLGDPGDPHDIPVRSRYATPPNFFQAARPSASPRSHPVIPPSVV